MKKSPETIRREARELLERAAARNKRITDRLAADKAYKAERERIRNLPKPERKSLIGLPDEGIVDAGEVKHWPQTASHFRDAWVLAGAARIGIDMEKAREIQQANIRQERAEMWPELDADYFKAVEAGNQELIDRAVGRKQAARDAPAHPEIEAAQTDAELAAVTLAAILEGAFDGD